ncbi:unnamed protein product [Arctogadus glacialis]
MYMHTSVRDPVTSVRKGPACRPRPPAAGLGRPSPASVARRRPRSPVAGLGRPSPASVARRRPVAGLSPACRRLRSPVAGLGRRPRSPGPATGDRGRRQATEAGDRRPRPATGDRGRRQAGDRRPRQATGDRGDSRLSPRSPVACHLSPVTCLGRRPPASVAGAGRLSPSALATEAGDRRQATEAGDRLSPSAACLPRPPVALGRPHPVAACRPRSPVTLCLSPSVACHPLPVACQ